MDTCVQIISTAVDKTLRGLNTEKEVIFSCRFLGGKAGYASYEDACEGDMKSPVGKYGLLAGYFRADRFTLPLGVSFPFHPTRSDEGWCDDSVLPEYNTPVTLPFDGSHERMIREDSAYDIVIPLSFNIDPVVPGKGSAIFFHIAPKDSDGTAGCIAIAEEDMVRLLPLITKETSFEIQN